MNIESGGYIVVNGPKDIYGIQKEEFKSTYKPTKEVDKMFEGERDNLKLDDLSK